MNKTLQVRVENQILISSETLAKGPDITIQANWKDIMKLFDYARIGAAHQHAEGSGDRVQHDAAIAEYNEYYQKIMFGNIGQKQS